jgi:3-deoxy-manno-octulosonate cytidylyltransferase (CMP-KDO synthetase)
MKINAFIPVRMSSSRFPGKPLTKLLNLTMLEHVWRRTKMSAVDETYVALCDKETIDICKKIGAKYIVTSKKHEMCMDRIAEAANKKKSDIIVTVQGDEPLIKPEMINLTIKNIINKKDNLFCTTLAQKISSKSEINNTNRVKIIWNKKKEVIYISREAIPSVSKFKNKIDYYKMVCVYTMTRKNLNKFQKFGISRNEKIESIDMLRILDNGLKLGIDTIDGEVENIDVKSDIPKVIKILKKDQLIKQYL